jgi:hypothetical protein
VDEWNVLLQEHVQDLACIYDRNDILNIFSKSKDLIAQFTAWPLDKATATLEEKFLAEWGRKFLP